MKKELMRVCAIAALVLMVVVCMASCGDSAKEEKVARDETKGSAVTSVADSAKTETPSESAKVEQSFIWPVEGFNISQIAPGFGNMIHPILGQTEFHTGVDIEANLGDKVLASSNGKVVKAEFDGDYGLCIVIEHDESIETLYAHLDKMLVKTGDIVKKGDLIGLAGSTGVSTGPHIHFEVKIEDKNGEYQVVDPKEFMREHIER